VFSVKNSDERYWPNRRMAGELVIPLKALSLDLPLRNHSLRSSFNTIANRHIAGSHHLSALSAPFTPYAPIFLAVQPLIEPHLAIPTPPSFCSDNSMTNGSLARVVSALFQVQEPANSTF